MQVKFLVNERDLNLAGVEMALKTTERLKQVGRRLRRSNRSDYADIADSLDMAESLDGDGFGSRHRAQWEHGEQQGGDEAKFHRQLRTPI